MEHENENDPRGDIKEEVREGHRRPAATSSRSTFVLGGLLGLLGGFFIGKWANGGTPE